MGIEHVLAVVPVSDIDRSGQWYTTLFGRTADNTPMASLCEWQVVPGGWVQVFHDPQRAGQGLVNFAVDHLDRHLAEVRSRGIDPDDVVNADKGVQLSAVTDPDGNTIRFIGGFRVEY